MSPTLHPISNKDKGVAPLTIEEIQSFCHAGKIQWTEHVMKRLIKRNITRAEIKSALMTGTIIEEYPADYPFPSCLVLGTSHPAHYLHVVCGIGNDRLWIITAYKPDDSIWDESFTKRREP